MAKLFGKEMTRKEICARIGNLSQVAGIKQYTYNSGRADGVEAIEVGTGDFSFVALPSRCLDIAFASYKGRQMGYISKSGIRSSHYFVERGDKGFLDNFFGGLMTTSGLNNIGASSHDMGKDFGMHGELSNIPADEKSAETLWNGDECTFRLRAKMFHSRFYAEDLGFDRVITAKLGENRLFVEDTVENLDFNSAPNMLLYHINFGYPLVDEHTEFITSPIVKTVPRTPKAARGLETFGKLSVPINNYEEECFYHWFAPGDNASAFTALYNPELDLSFYLRYDTNALPYFIQWKMMREREYVFGFAPATTLVDGRSDAREKGVLPFIQPFEKKKYRLELGVVEGRYTA